MAALVEARIILLSLSDLMAKTKTADPVLIELAKTTTSTVLDAAS